MTSCAAVQQDARITWPAEHLRKGLHSFTQSLAPAWLADAPSGRDAGWSLMYRFDRPPREQGNPSMAVVRFMVDAAPHGRLTPGTSLHLFERGTQRFATVEILE